MMYIIKNKPTWDILSENKYNLMVMIIQSPLNNFYNRKTEIKHVIQLYTKYHFLQKENQFTITFYICMQSACKMISMKLYIQLMYDCLYRDFPDFPDFSPFCIYINCFNE